MKAPEPGSGEGMAHKPARWPSGDVSGAAQIIVHPSPSGTAQTTKFSVPSVPPWLKSIPHWLLTTECSSVTLIRD